MRVGFSHSFKFIIGTILAILYNVVGIPSPLNAADNISEGPFVIHQIAGNPVNPSEIFAITSNYGVLKSEDYGSTWRLSNYGIKSFTHHALWITETRPPRLYIGAWGGGVSKSVDGGASWIEMNDGLKNTAVDAIVVDAGIPDRIYLATSTGFFRIDETGEKWVSFGEGLPPFPGEIKFKSLLLVHEAAKKLWLGTAVGLFYRPVNAPRWIEEGRFHGIRVSALAEDEKSNRVWVGTDGQGLFVRGKQEAVWTSVKMEKGLWINQIVLDPTDSQVIYVGTRGKGIYKSTDGGRSWSQGDTGIQIPDIRSLAIHPLNRLLLFAGTTSNGIFRSTDGGIQWSPSKTIPALSIGQIIGMLSTSSPRLSMPPVPGVFAKCNGCHGWTDSGLNQKMTYWRVPPNRRDWIDTVSRMAERARLTSDEASIILNFLTSYSRKLTE